MVRFKKRSVSRTRRSVSVMDSSLLKTKNFPSSSLLFRYLLVEISCKDGQVDERIDGRVVFDTVKKAVISAHGDYGMACVARSLQGERGFTHLRRMNKSRREKS